MSVRGTTAARSGSLAVVQTRKVRSLLRMVITFQSSTGPSPVTAMQDRT